MTFSALTPEYLLEFKSIVGLSLGISFTAIIISALIGLPLGTFLGLKKFPGRKIIMRLVYSFMSFPPVLAGLVIFLLFSRSGPLGFFGLLYTPAVMIVAQVTLATPIITGLTASAVSAKEKILWPTILTLGANHRQGIWLVMKETKASLIYSTLTAFGRIFGEVGAVMLVGGNIRFHTRVITTAIVLETRQGNFSFALSLGMVLLLISFVISCLVLSTKETEL